MFTRFFNNHFRGSGGINELFAVALPLLVSSSCETVMMFTDKYFLSKLGAEYMSASLGGGLTAFMFFTLMLGLIGYGTALVAQYYGAKIVKKCPIVFTQSVIMSFMVYPITLLFIPIGYIIFEKSGITIEQIVPQKIYFKVIMFGGLFGFIHHAINCYFSGIGRTKVIMITTIVTMGVNVYATYAFVFGNFGFPVLGVAGAALGTVLGHIAGILSCLCVYFGKKNRIQFKVADSFKLDKKVLRTIFRFGYPAGLEFFLNVVAFNFFIMTFQSYNLVVSAAVTIMLNWESVAFMPLVGMNTAITSLVGRYVGANDYDTAHRITKSGLKIITIYSLIGMFCFAAFGENMFAFFSGDNSSEILAKAKPLSLFMLRTISLYLFSDAFGLVFSGTLRGAGDTFVPMCISSFSSWMMFLVTFVLVKIYVVDPKVVWCWTITAFWTFNLMFFFRYRTGKWRSIKVIDDKIT